MSSEPPPLGADSPEILDPRTQAQAQGNAAYVSYIEAAQYCRNVNLLREADIFLDVASEFADLMVSQGYSPRKTNFPPLVV